MRTTTEVTPEFLSKPSEELMETIEANTQAIRDCIGSFWPNVLMAANIEIKAELQKRGYKL